jgi:hypothetical protein
MLTVVSSLRSQKRNILEFMRETIEANRKGNSTPSLIPRAIASNNDCGSIVTLDQERKDESMPLVA